MTDSSNWEQLGIVLRYVKDCGEVEKLFEFVQCEDIKGNSIAKYIIDAISNAGLDTKYYRSQTYDGAGNMAGKQKDAAKKFQLLTGNTKAPYIHCGSHELNLYLSKASNVPEVYNMVCTMQFLGIYFKFSPKRQRLLEYSINPFMPEEISKMK